MNQNRATNKHSNSDSPITGKKAGKSTKKNYRCRECLKYFASKQSLREHRYSHSNQKPYACNICDKSFRYGSQLCIHRKTHSVSTDIGTLKLTSLRPVIPPEPIPEVVLVEVVRLPKLGVTQSWTVPNLFLFNE